MEPKMLVDQYTSIFLEVYLALWFPGPIKTQVLKSKNLLNLLTIPTYLPLLEQCSFGSTGLLSTELFLLEIQSTELWLIRPMDLYVVLLVV